MFAHTQNTDAKPDWMLLIILSVVLLLIVVFQSCEQKQPVLTEKQLQRKYVIDSLQNIIEQWQRKRDSLTLINQCEDKEINDIAKMLDSDNQLLLDAVLETLIATYPKDTVEERWSDCWHIWRGSSVDNYYTDPQSKECIPAIVVYTANFKEKTVNKARLINPPNNKDLFDMFSDSIAGYEKIFEISGDFDGDGLQEQFDLSRDVHTKRSARLPAFPVDDYILRTTVGRHVYNEGDLDGDGADELSVHSHLFGTSFYDVWSIKKGMWKFRLQSRLTRDMRAVGIVPVRKHPTKKGWVRIHTIGSDGGSCCVILVEEKDINLRE
jgi:hypothetical protein